MSIKDRRNAVLKSSIGLKSIQDSVGSLGKGIRKSISVASEIVKQTRKSNVFKNRLISKDAEIFRKRRENVRRRDREDELEAGGVKGAAKAQGNVVSRSVKGLLGRVLNFFGIILLGWLLNTLPNILKSIQSLIKRIQRVIEVLTGYIDGVKDFLVGMGQSIQSIFDTLPKFDFNQGKQDADKASEQIEGGLRLANADFYQTVRDFGEPAGLGLDPQNPEGLIELEKEGEKKKGDESPPPEGADSKVSDAELKPEDRPVKVVDVGGSEKEEPTVIENRVEGIEGDSDIKAIKSEEAQSKGETIDKRNFEEEQKKDDENVEKSIVDGINARLDELVGGKAKKEAANAKSVDDNELVEEGKNTLVKSTEGLKDISPFKIARDFLNPFKNRNKDADTITPNTKNRSSLKRNRKRNRNTVMIVEKAVDTSIPQVNSGGGGNSKINLNMNDKNSESQIQKKMSSLALNK
tara:strand:- start:1420 stop:2811 length:1392 start_codon:yes stop_codon:yes gene_type:complete